MEVDFKVVPLANEVLLHLLVARNDDQRKKDNHGSWLKRAEDPKPPFPLGIGGQDGKEGHQRDQDDGAEGQREVILGATLIFCLSSNYLERKISTGYSQRLQKTFFALINSKSHIWLILQLF